MPNIVKISPDQIPARMITAGMLASNIITGILPSMTGNANKVLGINNGASGVEFKSIVASTGITVTHGVGTITITATGGVAPAAHASTHITGGADPIQLASASQPGILSAADWSTFNGKLSGNQTITLSGDVSGSGATSITTTIGAGKVTNAMLAGSIAYSKLVLTGAILNADLAGSIAYSKLSLTGAILNADLAGSIAASKLVGTDIATVGTITSGVWNAGAVTSSGTITTNGNLIVTSPAGAVYGNLTITGGDAFRGGHLLFQDNASTKNFEIYSNNTNTAISSQNTTTMTLTGANVVFSGTGTFGSSDNATGIMNVKGGASSYAYFNTGSNANDYQATSNTGYAGYALALGTVGNGSGFGSLITAGKTILASITGGVGIGGAPLRNLTVYAKSSTNNIAIEGVDDTGVHAIYLRPNVSSKNLISCNYESGGVYLPLSLSARESVNDFVLGTNGDLTIGNNVFVDGNVNEISQGIARTGLYANGDRLQVGSGLDVDGVELSINYLGYNYAGTRFRNLQIYDGKGASILNIVGSTKSVTSSGDIGIIKATANLYLKDTSTGFQSATTTIVTLQSSNSLRSTSFTSGLVGYSINAAGDAEFANITARGAIRSSLFLYNAVQSTGGTLGTFKSAAKLRADVTIGASPTYGTTTVNVDVDDKDGVTHASAATFAVNDIIRLKDGLVGDTWLKVASVSDQTTFWRYVCTIMAGTNTVTYNKGLGVADYGASGDGFIIQTADAANAPYMQMATHAATFSSSDASGTLTVTPKLRTGNLNGSYGYVSDIFGFAVGEYGASSKVSMTVDPTNGLRIINNTTVIGQWDDSAVITIGEVASAKSNVQITSGALNFRTNTTTMMSLSTGAVITVGEVASAKSNIVIDTGAIKLRTNTTDIITLDTSGVVVVGEVGASKSNVQITSGALNLRNNTTTLVSLSTAGVITVGEVGASKANILISSGSMSLRVNTTANITLNTDGTASFAGSISSSATITGGIVQTATSGNRIVMNGSTNKLVAYYYGVGDAEYTTTLDAGAVTTDNATGDLRSAMSWQGLYFGSSSTYDATIQRVAAGSFNFGGAGNGQILGVKMLTESKSSGGGSTSVTTSTIQIPANTLVLAVSVRVTNDGGNTSKTVTKVKGATSLTEFQTATFNITTGTTDVGTKNCVFYNASAQYITLDFNTVVAAPATFRVTIHYIEITAPTS